MQLDCRKSSILSEANTMNEETVWEFLVRQPFQPLQVHLSNGEIHQIRHPEFAMLLRSTLVIGVPDSDRVICCALLHVANIERLPATQPA